MPSLEAMKENLAQMQALRRARPYTAEWADGLILTLKQDIEDREHGLREGVPTDIAWPPVVAVVVAFSALLLAGALYVAGVL